MARLTRLVATNRSDPAHHSNTTSYTIGWTNTTIMTQTRTKSQLDLTEHAVSRPDARFSTGPLGSSPAQNQTPASCWAIPS